jgi:uncharacterized protein YkwD
MAGTLDTRIATVLAALAAAVVAALSLTGGAPDPAFAAGTKCQKANAGPRGTTSDKLGQAVECLIAKQRKGANVKQLDPVGSLSGVADKHSDVMIKEDCLNHRCDGEKSLEKRIVRSGYPIPGGRYGFAEITGCSVTPKAMVEAWMRKRVFRKRILGRSYRDVGVGAAKGSPNVAGCDDGLRGVYTAIFAWRKP